MTRSTLPGNRFVSCGKIAINGALVFTLYSLNGQALAAAGEEEKSANPQNLNEIIVTGEKTDRTLKRTSSSVTVISGEALKARPDAVTFADALQGTPNVLYTSPTGAPTIRGIDTNGPLTGGNTFLSKPIPRATINVDGRYISAAEYGLGGGALWDVSSMEVYRGPQTTSQGANSIAGAIVVKTNDPTFTPEFDGQVLYGSHAKKRASFAASGPVSDDIALRLAMDYSGRHDYINYTTPNYFDGGLDKRYENINARVKALFQPAESPWFKAKLTYSHAMDESPDAESATRPYHKLQNAGLSTNRSRTTSDVGIFDLQYDFENDITLSNQAQYSGSRYRYTFTKMFPGIARRDSHNVSNETRMNFGTEESLWSGMAGVFYSRETATNVLDNALGKADADLTNDSLGIFSEVTRRLAEKWRLTGGLRYQYDKVQHKGTTSYVPGEYHDYSKGFDAVLPKASLSYDITDDVTVGAMVSRGYAPGGTGVNFSGHSYYTFSPEKAWNYELFSRINALDNRLLLTSNLFYTDYKDFQSSVTDYTADRPNGSILVNADKAVVYGLETSADYRVLDNLRLRGGVGLLHSEIKKFNDYRGNAFEGNKLAKAPGYMFNLGSDWDITEQVRLSGDMRYINRYYSNDQNDRDLRVGSYAIANLRLAYSPTQNLELFTYVDNVFDRRTPATKANDRTAGVTGTMVAPRELGIGMKARF
ncbi:TonB-dependent receptor [Pluralibacter gergoviae]|uniref:TonB-dependent receptor n=1 Tax=Pluralibacter gergoviae TaxID=61647 RepID=UPI000BFDDBD8|nr:TonB-dependent receptor [Pluralibacter gergoviae]MCK1069221.1 TonB-dependent receptor [Pluralibacter gergoviae]MCV7759464.1 TonB-dependent receptor [Pluralibacter gergoviae]PHH44688.1 TonB-dependent receptor [Pluralibacter gergoviae]